MTIVLGIVGVIIVLFIMMNADKAKSTEEMTSLFRQKDQEATQLDKEIRTHGMNEERASRFSGVLYSLAYFQICNMLILQGRKDIAFHFKNITKKLERETNGVNHSLSTAKRLLIDCTNMEGLSSTVVHILDMYRESFDTALDIATYEMDTGRPA